METLDRSFDGNEIADLASVVAEFPDSEDATGDKIPVKKLSEEFDNVARSDENMKVYLRVRPIADKFDSTVTIESGNSIKTSAPDVSKRAQYTKMEERVYVSSLPY